jgi:hypothetical protein
MELEVGHGKAEHGEGHQREGTAKSYFASTPQRARNYAEYSIFKTT